MTPQQRVGEIRRLRAAISAMVAQLEQLEQTDARYVSYSQHIQALGRKRLPLDAFYELASELARHRQSGAPPNQRSRAIEQALGLDVTPATNNRPAGAGAPAPATAPAPPEPTAAGPDPARNRAQRNAARQEAALFAQIQTRLNQANSNLESHDIADALGQILNALEMAEQLDARRLEAAELVGEALLRVSAFEQFLNAEQQRRLAEGGRRLEALM